METMTIKRTPIWLDMAHREWRAQPPMGLVQSIDSSLAVSFMGHGNKAGWEGKRSRRAGLVVRCYKRTKPAGKLPSYLKIISISLL